MPEPLSLEQLLDNQESGPDLFVTIERIEGSEDAVKVTPWSHGICQCDIALEIPKSAIESVTPTGDTHPCCGKVLSIVRPTWAERVWADVLKQLASRHVSASPQPSSPIFPQAHKLAAGATPALDPQCLERCYLGCSTACQGLIGQARVQCVAACHAACARQCPPPPPTHYPTPWVCDPPGTPNGQCCHMLSPTLAQCYYM